ncbi:MULTISPECIES: TetR/AcrR family transcriptional regulator [Vibrio]|uniref:TetR/AcrR family transcriptional regulator n=1 Tax=Vibrio harveyi TaxID=669 RepID=A0A2S0SBM4_VIBHA|nr:MULTISPECIES: TetR/AcrR family transcriptional regulator [Vibrio]AMF96917.1 TetR/AcrR family transcriptional regulator [Vibrio harveyi]AWA99998.1 TetR/AcrR family transcriptional regulator [Vibrio harveyi]EKM13852.1 bacterial regulatory s, tetR family protein [Vibrio harveyi]EKO3809192.1 TetR/AcrR family transcriptional regulator [Vibrio harveyi]EKO3856290.1 TetR/AcrR family transcriptional regulator [Vibrio harveyi]
MPAPKYTIAEQEQLILDAAVQCVLDSSLIDFKMSDIAKNAGLSMGSVYKHIQSKEDVLVALSVRIDKQASNVIREVLELPYSLPTKIVAIHLVSQEAMYTYSFSYQLLTMLNSKDLLAKSSEKWLMKLALVSKEIRCLFQESLRAAVEEEELLCSDEEKESLIEEFMLLHWALNIGFPQILNHPYDTYINEARTNVNVPLTLTHPLVRAAVRMTNSYPWKKAISTEELEEIEQVLIERGLR